MASLADLAALAATFRNDTPAKPAEPALPEGWTYIRTEGDGRKRYRVYAIFEKRLNAVEKAMATLPVESSRHEVGDICPHCLGAGRYSAHMGHFHNDKCYRCDGKGTLDAKDLAFFQRRVKGAGPVCHVVTA
ncbi:hypothetical protein [Celeribacter sp.]|uniref:hypothetical protein n=1 Tax=Celeribacter sp. TaxID=1890673 RepID=UPI003A92009F